jgi:hypothetical protein
VFGAMAIVMLGTLSGDTCRIICHSPHAPHTARTTHRPRSTVHRAPSTVHRPPSTVRRARSTIHGPPSTVHRPPHHRITASPHHRMTTYHPTASPHHQISPHHPTAHHAPGTGIFLVGPLQKRIPLFPLAVGATVLNAVGVIGCGTTPPHSPHCASECFVPSS